MLAPLVSCKVQIILDIDYKTKKFVKEDSYHLFKHLNERPQNLSRAVEKNEKLLSIAATNTSQKV